MAPKTGLAGLVALALLLNSSLVSAVTTASQNYKMTLHHKSTTAPVASTATAATSGSSLSNGTIIGTNTTAVAPVALNATVVDCFLTLPDNALTAQGLATPFQLMAPCSMTVATQRAFVEAAVFDPATGDISIYHPLVIDAGKTPQIAPVVPALPNGAIVGLWFGFNGATLQLLDTTGGDTNTSPKLKAIGCVNGLPGVKGDVFGQVSWCNTVPFFNAADASIAAGKTVIPPLGTDKNGNTCPSSRSFTIVDACPSDNLPTQYLLLGDGTTVQDTAANRAAQAGATVLDNASDEALIGLIVDPLIGCTVFQVPSLDDPGAKVGSLVTQELQARQFQAAPIANVPLNDPDCLLTANGGLSTDKTNAYRLGVNQVPVSQDPGSLDVYCNNMISIAPPFLKQNQATFTAATTPDAGVGSNLFNFLCNRYLMSLMMLTCPPNANQPVVCQFDGNGAATSCTINIAGNGTTGAAGTTGGAGAGAGASSTATAAGGMGGGMGGGAATSTTLATIATATAAGGGMGGGKATSTTLATVATATAAGGGASSTATAAGGMGGGMGGGKATSTTLATIATTTATGTTAAGGGAGGNGNGGLGALSSPVAAAISSAAAGGSGAVSSAVIIGSQGAATVTVTAAPSCTCTCMAAAKAAAKRELEAEAAAAAAAPVPAAHFGRRSVRRSHV